MTHKPRSGHVNKRLCLSSALALYGAHEHVVSGSEDGRLCIWDLQTKRPLQGLAGHADAVLAVAKHPTEAVLATGGVGKDCSIRLWRIPALAPSFDHQEEEEEAAEEAAAPAVAETAVAEMAVAETAAAEMAVEGEGEAAEPMDQSA